MDYGKWSHVFSLKTTKFSVVYSASQKEVPSYDISFLVGKFLNTSSYVSLGSLRNEDDYGYDSATKQEYHWLKQEK